jgi:hypothetical protein
VTDEYDEWETPDEDETPDAVQFKMLDLAGAVIHSAGRVLMSTGGALQDIAVLFHRGAWFQRLSEEEMAQLARDRAEFDNIITNPTLYTEE